MKKCLEVLKAATAHNSGIILQNHYFFLFFQILIFSFSNSIFRYSYYRSSIADKISDYEDIWEPKSERCLSPAESELQFKALDYNFRLTNADQNSKSKHQIMTSINNSIL